MSKAKDTKAPKESHAAGEVTVAFDHESGLWACSHDGEVAHNPSRKECVAYAGSVAKGRKVSVYRKDGTLRQ